MDPNVGSNFKLLPDVLQSQAHSDAAMTGCRIAVTSLQAANFDPNAISDTGTCTYLYEDPETGKKTEGDLRDFVTTTVGSLFGGNKSDTSGPNWEGTGYAYSGDKVSQRDIERLVSVICMLGICRH